MKLIIPGQPKSQKRHRHGNGRTWDPSAADKKLIQQELLQIKPTKPIVRPVRVEINAFFQTPKSWSDKQIRLHEGKPRPKTPDGDNIAKIYMDSANGLLWKDDNQVTELTVRKFYSDHPCTEIKIEQIKD